MRWTFRHPADRDYYVAPLATLYAQSSLRKGVCREQGCGWTGLTTAWTSLCPECHGYGIFKDHPNNASRRASNIELHELNP